MPSKRVPTPKQTIKIRRPKKGDSLQLIAEVTRIEAHDDDTRWDKVTVRIPGYPIPVTLRLRDVYGEDLE